jgi:hypothetical protein
MGWATFWAFFGRFGRFGRFSRTHLVTLAIDDDYDDELI